MGDDDAPRAPATARGGTAVPSFVLDAIYGKKPSASASARAREDDETSETTSKSEAYDASLRSWWRTYSERKNDEDEEHVADSLLYDYRHLPRTTPAPNYSEDRLKPAEPDPRRTGRGESEK